MMMMKSEKDDMPKMATKSYSYGGRVPAAGSMEKPEKREMDAMMMTPREPYTTKEEEQKRKEEAMSFMPSIMKKMMG
tara:strand:- start:125 stop:355 length:231 start_codon:yes stop_codon:yes gene_type:complete